MSYLPDVIKTTGLFKRLCARADFVSTVESLRKVAEALGSQIERLIPEFTDHSVRHMDALWSVSDAILIPDEIERCTIEEVFLLCCSFYVHDLGMAIASTSEGIENLRSTAEYKAALHKAPKDDAAAEAKADALAIRIAARSLHAELASSLMIEEVPGLNRYLIEDSETREKWGPSIGEIAASHNWTLEQLELRLGRREVVPTADNGSADLGYVACLLRIADYAHINRERALQLERLLRSEISPDSSLHWDAQANITGPNRDTSQLVYGCTAPVTSIDAWWQFYDMVSALEMEIRCVRDYLEGRKVSAGRFTLQGVRGAESPESFASYVRLNNEIAPIDIRVQPNSMERVIALLGGPALYRNDPMAPLRELIQNCRDAIALRNALETAEHQDVTPGKIDITLDTKSNPPILKVRDNGVGMTRSVVKNHLITVASNFWNSVDYARDFSRATEAGFQPIGRFGIGFLSVFMLGSNIEVETERAGSPRILLRLRGIGRRGELTEKVATGRTGSEVRIFLNQSTANELAALPKIIRARAPMLPYQIRIEMVTENETRQSSISPHWWATASSNELYEFLETWNYQAKLGRIPEESEGRYSPHFRGRYRKVHDLEKSSWPGVKPDFADETGRLIDSGQESASGVLQCSHGIAIGLVSGNGIFGLVETGEVEILPDRNTTIDKEDTAMPSAMNQLMQGLEPCIRKAVDDLEQFGSIPARHAFLSNLVKQYGSDILSSSTLRWIPMLEQPGNLIHKSRSEVMARLQSEYAVVLCSGISPGKAYGLAEQRLDASERVNGVEILLQNNEFSPNYDVEQRLEVQEGSTRLRGAFNQVIAKAECKKEGFRLLGILLDLIAEAWSIPRDTLEMQTWELDADYTKGYLWVNLKRPQHYGE